MDVIACEITGNPTVYMNWKKYWLTLCHRPLEEIFHMNIMETFIYRRLLTHLGSERLNPEGTFCDTLQVPSGVVDMKLI